MKSINPYLNFPGTAEEAFNFYRSVFGGEFAVVQRFKESPEGNKLSAEDAGKLMHISLPLPNGNVLMATDALESMGHPLQTGNNFHLTIETDSREEADTLFARLSASGNVVLPMTDMFWGAYYGMLTDKFGIQWMISHSAPPAK